VAIHLHQPGARPDIRVGIQIRDVHKLIEPQMDAACHDEVKRRRDGHS
jgi:hypothetical protein